jgi:hypothetical protein
MLAAFIDPERRRSELGEGGGMLLAHALLDLHDLAHGGS